LSLTSGDVYHALNAFCLRVNGRPLVESRNHVKCFVRRDSLFQDGVILMERVAVTPLQFALQFVGEEAVGTGPIQEFLTLFAKELAKVSRGMWRNSFDNPGPLVSHEHGLFPLYSAEVRLFFLLGVLCAKAVQMRFIVPLPFNVAFFKLVKGEAVSLAEVDSTMANSLKSVEGFEGMPFVLPGTDEELKPGGREILVTPENFREYRELITDFVCGSKLRTVVAGFKRGFRNLFQPGCLHLMSARELCLTISGDDTNVTLEDLQENVELSNGFVLGSPQVRMFFEIILEMSPSHRSLFFKFVTGSDRLPIGGLGGLHPRMNVAKKVGCDGDSLPSAMTCKNYFKLPAYETKEVMAAKLILAIEEGQGQLLLT
jgi:E3 ubiquitin-protein ligase TRIP12